MGVIHRYKGDFDWEGVAQESYPPERNMKGVTVRRLIGPAEAAPNYSLRYFEVEAGGWSCLEQHAHDHGVMVMRGQGSVQLGDEHFKIAFGDVIYIPGDQLHQLRNTGDEPFGFLCVIPALE